MAKEGKEPDPMTELLRQMGLCEEEIQGALDLADKIEKKVEVKCQSDTIPTDIDTLSRDALIETINDQKSQLSHFNNVVAPQFILMIKKYKDRVIALEEKLKQKNAKIEDLSLKLEYRLK